MSFRSNYWSCSALADRIRGVPKGGAKNQGDWRNWKQQAKTQHPVRFWIAEEGLNKLQDIIHWPIDIVYNIRYYINNRWIAKTHAMTSNLEKGRWHEFDTRLLHCMFDALVDFVEIESAWMEVAFSNEAAKKYQLPWWRKSPFRIRAWRCPEAGVANLEWAAGLKWNEDWVDPADPDYGQPTHQAKTAQEVLALYKWWKETRPARPDIYEVSGWSDYCEKRRIGSTSIVDETPETKIESRRILDIVEKMESDYEREDTEMMIKLIQIRQGLWT